MDESIGCPTPQTVIRDVVNNTRYPIVIRKQCTWPLLEWSLEQWGTQLQGPLRFRQKPRSLGEEPCWERACPYKCMSFQEFVSIQTDRIWFYYDYNYIEQACPPDSELCKLLKWETFGFPEIGAKESTLWVGSEGAHTPCHQDSYGKNIVLQVYGSKTWMLFSPDTPNMKETRIPYEESSLYSQHNFYYPKNLNSISEILGCRMVTLEPGDALIVPHKWWHYVEHVSPVGISINTWIPCNSDSESRVEESITRTIVSQFSKDVPEKCLLQILNPNEDDVPDITLAANLLQLEMSVTDFQKKRSNNAKRIRSEKSSQSSDRVMSEKEIEAIIEDCENLSIVTEISRNEFIDILKNNVEKRENICSDSELNSNVCDNNKESENSVDTDFQNHFSCKLLKAMCQPNVIKQIKENLVNEYV